MGDDLWGPLDDGKKKRPVISLATKEDRVLNKKSKLEGPRGKLLAIGAGGIVTALVLGGLIVGGFAPWEDNGNGGKKAPTEANPVVSTDTEWYDKAENKYPVEGLPEFQTNEGGGQSIQATELPKDLGKYVSTLWDGSPTEGIAETTLPGEDVGFTSNPEDAVLEDGTLNPLFTYWTPELFKAESSIQVSKLINPSYGGWGRYQFSSANAAKSFNPADLGDTFSADFYKKVEAARGNAEKMKALVPIYADWNANNYGMGDKLISSDKAGFRWVGVIDGKVTTKWAYDAKTLNYRVKAVYPVTYTSWTDMQSREVKKGTLTVNFVADQAAMSAPTALRVVVDSGTLKLS